MKRIQGFTLAEILITLAVIGVVAAITMPTLINTVSPKTKKVQKEVIEAKINNAMESMQISGELMGQYSSTLNFINKLKNHMKIVQICSPNSIGGNNIPLEKCLTYDKIIVRNNNTQFDINNAQDGNDTFFIGANSNTNYGEVVGLILGNGTPVILAYNKNCEPLDPDSKYPKGKVTNCISAIYDINGKTGPNRYGKDVIGINIQRFATGCAIEDRRNKCFTTLPFKPVPLSHNECISLKDQLGIDTCLDVDGDYWAGTVKTCGGKRFLPNVGEAHFLVNTDMYTAKTEKLWDYNPNSETAAIIGIVPPFAIWSNHENLVGLKVGTWRYRYYDENGYGSYAERTNSAVYGICQKR